jgi:hypothetical protein
LTYTRQGHSRAVELNGIPRPSTALTGVSFLIQASI